METQRDTYQSEVVISGVSCCFAGAPNARAFWKNILRAVPSFTPFSATEDAFRAVKAHRLFPERDVPQFGGFLKELFACSADRVPIPTDFNSGDNPDFYFTAQLLFDALKDAGLSHTHPSTDRIGLFLAYAPPFTPAHVNWLQHAAGVEQAMAVLDRFFPGAGSEQMDRVRAELTATLPPLCARQIELAQPGLFVTRLLQLAGGAGPAAICDNGDTSIFTAIQQGMDALRRHRCDVALVGAIQPPFNETTLLGHSGAVTFSRKPALLPFTAEADGTLPGEGGAFFVLRRAEDAEKAGDLVYAQLRGSGTAVSAEGGRQALLRAIHRGTRHFANGFRDVDYWEMNASGIPEEDAAELAVLEAVTDNRGAHIPLLALGSVKTLIGHTHIASGAASLLKAVLALNHTVLPPSATPESESFALNRPDRYSYWVTEPRPWVAASHRPRRMAVTTFSSIGIAGCCILQAPAKGRRGASWGH